MEITFLGASQMVTGSCYLIETAKTKFLLDCGMFQGGVVENELNYEPFIFSPEDIDFVILSHAHIDHSGRIPLLFKRGFNGYVYTTEPTKDLCSVMLPDSGHIQESEIEWINRKRKRNGKDALEPLYTYDEAVKCLPYFVGVKYNHLIKLSSDVSVKFIDAGHMLGSSIIEIYIEENGDSLKLVFSGDLGNKNIPILRDPSHVENADILLLESTYGNRLHKDLEGKSKKFIEIIKDTINKGGKVIIPSFAVGRTQEILYEIFKSKEINNEDKEFLKNVEVFVDSPLANMASEIYHKHIECFDEEAQRFIKEGFYPLDFPNLKFIKDIHESKWLNEYENSCIIISSSGMCEAGRIKHHLKHNLWKSNTTVLFVGYQAPNTLGRKLLDGAKKVRIFGEDIEVNARIEFIDAYSGHADMKGLIEWLKNFENLPKKLFLVHGEKETINDFSKVLKGEFNIEVNIPVRGQKWISTAKEEKEWYVFSDRSRFVNLSILSQLDDILDTINDLKDKISNGNISNEILNDIESYINEVRYQTSLLKSIL